MGKLTLLLIILLIWLQYSLWFGRNGFLDYSCIKSNVLEQQTKNEKLKARNKKLFAEIDDLSNNHEIIEERARNRLIMTKSNETFYRMVLSASKRNQNSVINN